MSYVGHTDRPLRFCVSALKGDRYPGYPGLQRHPLIPDICHPRQVRRCAGRRFPPCHFEASLPCLPSKGSWEWHGKRSAALTEGLSARPRLRRERSPDRSAELRPCPTSGPSRAPAPTQQADVSPLVARRRGRVSNRRAGQAPPLCRGRRFPVGATLAVARRRGRVSDRRAGQGPTPVR